jgi:hypothetical protein
LQRQKEISFCLCGPIDVTEPLSGAIFLLRFLCFMAVIYLALHALVVRTVSKPDSKLLWFFSVVTDPLVRPVRSWVSRDSSASHIVLVALVVYSVLWILLIVAGNFLA